MATARPFPGGNGLDHQTSSGDGVAADEDPPAGLHHEVCSLHSR